MLNMSTNCANSLWKNIDQLDIHNTNNNTNIMFNM